MDANRLGQSEATAFGHHIEVYRDRFKAFGWRVEEVDGHDIEEILEVLSGVGLDDKPLAIIAKTYKGAGVSFLQDKEGWHGKPLNKEEAARAVAELQPGRQIRPGRGHSGTQPVAGAGQCGSRQLSRRSTTRSATWWRRAKLMAPLWPALAKWTSALWRLTATPRIRPSRTNFSKNSRLAPPRLTSPSKTWWRGHRLRRAGQGALCLDVCDVFHPRL